MAEIRLSKSALDKFVGCPRCFYLQYKHKLGQPDMISSKVWKGVERVTINYYESHRIAKTTPEHLIGAVPDGAIPYQGDRIDMKALRYWGKGLAFEIDGILITTALDDMLQWKGGDGKTRYAVLDFKSKSKLTDEDATRDLYANQADVFDLACNVNDYPTDGVVYFDYHSPVSIEGAEPRANEGDTGFTVQKWAAQVIALKADHARIKKLVLAAAACLNGPMPDPNLTRSTVTRGANKGQEKVEGCPICVYQLEREELFTSLKVPA